MSSQCHYDNKNAQKSDIISDMGLKEPLYNKIIKNTSVGLIAFLAAFVSFSALSPIEPTNATEVLSALDVNNGTVSLTTSSNAINLSLAAGSAGAVRTALDTVSVTSGSAGYQLYISTNGDNALIRDGATSTGTDTNTGLPTYSENDLIPASLTTNISSPDVLSNDTWGFAVPAKNTTAGSGSEDVVINGFDSSYPTGDNSVATSKFIAVPAKGNDLLVAKRSSATSGEGNATNFYYGIRATSAKPSGLYKNTITYTAIGDGSIADLASVSPNKTNQLAGGQTLTIATPSTLALSSISSVTVTVGNQTCGNPNAIKNNDGAGPLINITCTSPALATGWHAVIATITTTSDTTETYVVNPGIEYYLDEGDSQVATYMQDFTITDCANMASLSSITLQDSRDNNIYRITKQADGNCWMTENLRLGNTSNNDGIISQDIILNSSNSDIPTSLKAPNGTDPYTFTIASDKMQTSTFVPSGYDTNWNDSNWDKQRIYTFTADPNSTTSTINKRAYGNLYNWYTATAGSGTHNGVINGADASSSICPKGWKLPSNTGDGSHINLIQAQIPGIEAFGTNTIYTDAFQQSPLYYITSGYYVGIVGGQGIDSDYWSRTSSSSNNNKATGFYFSVNSGSFNSSNVDKYHGRAVRCVFMSTMQSLTTVACTNLQTAQTIALTDARDLNTYAITKEADGNCWMTENLRLGNNLNSTGLISNSIVLTSDNSDIPTNGTNFTINPTLIQTSAFTPSGYTTDWDDSGNWDKERIYSFTADSDSTTSATNKKAYGNLYNWYTATAGSGTRTGVTGGADAPASICPKGWQLPPSTGNGSYSTLIQSQIPGIPSYGTNTIYTDAFQQAPLNFVLSGVYGSSPTQQNGYGQYWYRTSYSSDDDARDFHFNNANGQFYLLSYYRKYIGRAVRCVMIP